MTCRAKYGAVYASNVASWPGFLTDSKDLGKIRMGSPQIKAVWVDICSGCDAALWYHKYTSSLWFNTMPAYLYRSNRERKCADTIGTVGWSLFFSCWILTVWPSHFVPMHIKIIHIKYEQNWTLFGGGSKKLKFCVVICYVRNAHSRPITYQSDTMCIRFQP